VQQLLYAMQGAFASKTFRKKAPEKVKQKMQ
jgi:hypothetical protein